MSRYMGTAVVGERKTETQWPLSEPAQVLSGAPNQISSRGFFPGRPAQHNVPSGRTLKSLSEAGEKVRHKKVRDRQWLLSTYGRLLRSI